MNLLWPPATPTQSLLVSSPAAIASTAPAAGPGKKGVSIVGVSDVARSTVATPSGPGSKRGAAQASDDEDESMPEVRGRQGRFGRTRRRLIGVLSCGAP